MADQTGRRFRECAEAFGQEGEYSPACCRFPKSCSPYPYQEAIDAGNVKEADLEPPDLMAALRRSIEQARPPEPPKDYTADDFRVAVGVRPHYPPCDHPDNPCSCGAAEDRIAIAQALAAQRERLTQEANRVLAEERAAFESGAQAIEAEAVHDFISWLEPLGYELRAEGESGPGLTHDEMFRRWKES